MSDSQEEFEYESTVREEKEYRDISRSLDPEGTCCPSRKSVHNLTSYFRRCETGSPLVLQRMVQGGDEAEVSLQIP